MLRGAKLKHFLGNLKIYCTNRFPFSANLIPLQKYYRLLCKYSLPIFKYIQHLKKTTITHLCIAMPENNV